MEKLQILIKFKEFIKDSLGLYVIILVIMADLFSGVQKAKKLKDIIYR